MMKLTHRVALVLAFASIAATLTGDASPPGVTPEAGSAPLPAAVAKSLAEDIATELRAGDLVAIESRFDDEMKSALPDGKLRAFWSGVVAKGGALKSCATPRTYPAKEFTLAFATCTFEREKAELKLTFRSDGRLAGMFLEPDPADRPSWAAPEYVRPAAFRETAVRVVSGAVFLPGTVTIPLGAGPFPGVVLVHGSGPQDRDETIGGLRPFQDLAQGLASRGIVVLRYDKRTKVYAKELAKAGEITVKDEVLDDALAALKVLRETPGVDTGRLVVVGHSLGALLAPRIAALDPAVSAVAMLAAPSRPMSEVVRDQAAWLAGPGATDAEKLAAGSVHKQAELLAELYAGRPDPLGAPILGASPSYWLDLAAEKPVDAARSLGRPILVLQGERDYQVTMNDFRGWKRALAGRKGATFRSYPKLNHFFVAGEGRSGPQEVQKPGHVAGEVVNDIAAFVNAVPRKKT